MNDRKFPEVLKIVTVEDSSIILSRMKSLLSDIGGVEFLGNACTVPEALVLIETGRPDVAILDIHLNRPDGNGIDLLLLIRGTYPAMKIIMLTNMTETLYRTQCEKAGADFFLDKSNEFDRITDTLTRIIDLKRSID